ncbi:hypothetical protein BSKO_01063 [Bryopsis sp. KO-2023]|nr:hypothetical protein BSKO_01063 [Bryopsis sp. KO-2023]
MMGGNQRQKRKQTTRAESESKRQAVGGSIPAPAPSEPVGDVVDAEEPDGVAEVLQRKLTFRKGASLKAKVDLMGPFIKELRQAGQGLLQERDDLLTQLCDSKAEKENVDSARNKDKVDFEKREKDLAKERAQVVASFEEKLDAARGVTERKTKELAETEGRLKKAEERSENLQACNSTMQEKLEQAHERNGKLLEDVQKLTASLQRNNQEAERARVDLNNEILEQKGKNVGLAETVEVLEKQRSKEEQQSEYLRQELTRAAEDRDAARKEAQDAIEQLEQLKADTGATKDQMEKMEYTKAALEGHFTNQGAVVEDLRRQLRIAQEGEKLTGHLTQQKDIQLSELQAEKERLESFVAGLEDKVREGDKIRKKLHNTILELKGNIRVFGRVRPAGESEVATDAGSSDAIISFPTFGDEVGRGITLMAPPAPRQPFQDFKFTFDQVFKPEATQENVFEEISQLVQSALDGYKVCIFAYGQTGSGKTFTMLGTKEQPGVIPRAMTMLFSTSEELRSQGWRFAMHASMLEIYNEEYKDLLLKGSASGKNYKVSHDAQGNTNVSDLTVVDVQDPGQVEKLLATAMEKRAVGATRMNEVSSRSHMVFTLKIDGYNSSTQQSIHGVLNLVDLAGSERVKESGATGDRLKEAQNINKSLSALGDVIMALTNKAEHIPYRNSSLTRLLQPSLGGSSKTLMFVNVAPTRASAGESLCSLRFAAKVNACEVGVAKRSVGNSRMPRKSFGS